jgi:hypothetical protein
VTVLTLAPSRLTVQYGGFTIDESHGCILHSEYDAEDTSVYGSFYIEFRVRLLNQTSDMAADDATFAGLVNDVETNLRIPRQRLKVSIGGQLVRDWNFQPTGQDHQTAFLIAPELKLIEENCRDYKYGFRVRCQFPGNVPNNVFRRESLTTVGASLRERRSCTISATWTSTTGETAYDRYLASGDAFFNGVLPANFTDQHSNVGAWVQADHNPSFNDENSLLTVTRTYWEVFAGRRESTVVSITRIDGRRVCSIPSVWIATPGFTALENYLDNGGAFFTAVLPTPVSSGEWVLVDEEPAYNDQNGVLNVIRTYHEVVSGLRDYDVRITTDEAGLRHLELSGTYYATTGNTAKNNYATGISALVTGILSAYTITQAETHSVPKVEGYDTTGLRYFFKWTINELAYPQGPGAYDDPNVLLEFLEVRALKPFDPQSSTTGLPVTRLSTVVASFVASIDTKSAGGGDPVNLWETKFRGHVVSAVTSKLGTYATAVQVVEEEVGAVLDSNKLVGTLRLVVTGGSLLSLRMIQVVTQWPGRSFVGRGDGTAHSYKAYRAPPAKRLYRECTAEYVLGATLSFFAVGDNAVSGFGFIDTGKTAQQSVDDQDSSSTLPSDSWFIDRDSNPPLVNVDYPTDRGDNVSHFKTVMHVQKETWLYVAALEDVS